MQIFIKIQKVEKKDTYMNAKRICQRREMPLKGVGKLRADPLETSTGSNRKKPVAVNLCRAPRRFRGGNKEDEIMMININAPFSLG